MARSLYHLWYSSETIFVAKYSIGSIGEIYESKTVETSLNHVSTYVAYLPSFRPIPIAAEAFFSSASSYYFLSSHSLVGMHPRQEAAAAAAS